MASATSTMTEAAAPRGGAGTLHLQADNCLGAARVKVTSTVSPPVVDMTLHADNRQRLVQALRAAGAEAGSVVVLQGGKTDERHDTDHENLFRQESNFHWAFGVREPDCYGSIDVDTGRAVLYIPRLDPVYLIWSGKIKSPQEWKDTYLVDDVQYVGDLVAALTTGGATGIHLLAGTNTDGKKPVKPAEAAGLEAFAADTSLLWSHMSNLRAHKTAKELSLLRHICTASSEAHLAVMQHARAGMHEYQLESLFQHWCYYHGGARQLSYTCICASGHNGSVLHYGHAGEPNAKMIREGDMCLFDMGAEYHCYGSDITCSFPVSGKFTPDQRIVYGAVLAAQIAVMDAMKPGVAWRDMHKLAYRVILTHLRDGGLLTGDVDDMMSENLGATFMPHGLGHFLGIDTHDVGGYPDPAARPIEAGFKSLRTTRVLEPGMYMTVEPGVYFIDHLLDTALADPAKARFINAAVLGRFRGTGGVRLEDDVLVTEAGIENFTHAPRTVEDIEAVLAGAITQRAQLRKFH